MKNYDARDLNLNPEFDMQNTTKIAVATSLLLSTSSVALADDLVSIYDSHSTKINEKLPADSHNSMHVMLDTGWDSKYVSQGRNNLEKGGINWLSAAIQKQNFNAYVTVGRADSEHYIEYNLGLEYSVALSQYVNGTIGYQRLEFYGAERAHDNEIFSALEYNQYQWLTPSINYTYSTESAGYFIEISLHSNWDLTDTLSVTPYISQGFDFKYATPEHNGANNVQFGVEAQYQLPHQWQLSAHISHSIAAADIKQAAAENTADNELNQTYAGIHLSWSF
ncbi:hypothetical protein N9W21_02265 [Shewanella sp.]|nr:hypothetical protein [Shewanella sp.]